MFRGTTLLHLDNKGRLIIPTRYRHVLKEDVVVTIDLYQCCLLLYSLAQWEQIEQQLLTLSAINQEERRIQRLLLGHANECHMDNSGRILLPAILRQHAKLKKDVVLVGQLNKFELWNEAMWHTQIEKDLAMAPTDLKNLSDRLKNLTL